jgi:hypothetical protein
MTLEADAGGRDLSTHILGASVVVIGVSTTLIGLVKVAKAHMGPTHVDQYVGLAALLFLLAQADPTYPFATVIVPALVSGASR